MLCPPDSYPQLGPDDLDEMVRSARRADALGFPPDAFQPWQPGSYGLGATAVPSDRNGIVYQVTARTATGATGATEPAWPISGTIVDGDLTWSVADSAPWTPTWAINAGVAKGWRIKAGKAAARFSFSAGTDRFDTNQVAANCLLMAKQYEGGGIAKLRSSDVTLDVTRFSDVIGN